MGFQRFVLLNLVLVPALVIGGYLFGGTIPLALFVLAVGYCTFAVLISLVWGLSQISAVGEDS